MWKEFLRRIGPRLEGRRKTLIIAGTVGLALIVVVSTFWIMRRDSGTPGGDVRLKIIPEHVDLQIKDIHYTEVGDPDLTWEIHADTARYVKKDNLAYFDRVRIRLIRKDGKALTLTGNEGLLHTDTKDADVSGRVVIVSNNGDIVETDKLHYSHGERKIMTDRKITLRKPGMVVDGVGMSLSLAEERVSLLSGVKAVINTEKVKR